MSDLSKCVQGLWSQAAAGEEGVPSPLSNRKLVMKLHNETPTLSVSQTITLNFFKPNILKIYL